MNLNNSNFLKEHKDILKITTTDGEEINYHIICAFASPKTGHHYVVYTEDIEDNDHEKEIYASIYDPEDDTKLDEIKTDEEWELIEMILNDLGVINYG